MAPADRQQRIRLANGVRVRLIEDPAATQSAALLQLAAGSHHEPAAWPGLAHLLEHVLFTGSKGFQESDRLMAWVPAQGGKLNATTLTTSTAWFVGVNPAQLDAALARLVDMLAFPLMAVEAIAQEVAVIDAEYRMLASHTETLTSAALSHAFAQPHPLHRFQVGNQASFGEDNAALQRALRAYHRRFFHAGRLTLWLQGPQPLAEQRALAERWGNLFRPDPALAPPRRILRIPLTASGSAMAGARPPADGMANSSSPRTHCISNAPRLARRTPCTDDVPRLALQPHRAFALHHAAAHLMLYSFIIDDPAVETFSLLQALLQDTAAYSLLATLRAAGLCDDLRLLEPWRSPVQSVLTIEFQLCEPAGESATLRRSLEVLFTRWLVMLQDLPAGGLSHYAALALQRFRQHEPLDQLRARAFSLPPPESKAERLAARWQHLLSQLRPERMTRLEVSPEIIADRREVQGFWLELNAVEWPGVACQQENAGSGGDNPLMNAESGGANPLLNAGPGVAALPVMAFYSGASLPSPSILPSESVALHSVPGSGIPCLLLSPLPDQPLSPRVAAIVTSSLQTVSGDCLHNGGELSFSRRQGIWLLQLRGNSELLPSALNAVIPQLIAPSASAIRTGERLARRARQRLTSDIAVRCLLAQLPGLIRGEGAAEDNGPHLPHLRWSATLYGGDKALSLALARLLSRFPAEVNPEPLIPAARVPGRSLQCPTESRDAAAVVFCPLTESTAACLAAWQLMAVLFEPRFFQQYRVEKNIGYVVSCRFHQVSGVAGLLFALQSPSRSVEELLGYIAEFIMQRAEGIDGLTEEAIRDVSLPLREGLHEAVFNPTAYCLTDWQQRQLALPALTADSFAQLSPISIRKYYRQLAHHPECWWQLSNFPLTP
ncbi:insulinase family protein [Erwinia tasmaniensis]|uniref:insulinase family protein n=1 Tax=Erwinia tasmaniensis TaxID=338565 RepID=UPI003A4D86BA